MTVEAHGALWALIALLVAVFAWTVVATGRRPDAAWPVVVAILLITFGTFTSALKMAADGFYGGGASDDYSVWWGSALVVAGLTLLVRRVTARRRNRSTRDL